MDRGNPMRRLKHQLTWGLLSLVLVSVFMNCSPSIQITDPSAVGSAGLSSTSGQTLSSLATKTQAILQAQCFSCHGVAASGGVTNITNLNHLQTSGLVVAGQPNSSSLLRSISEGRMPPGQPMNAADEKVIYDWIVALGGSSSGGGGIGAPGGPIAGGVVPTPTPPVVGGGGGGVVIEPTFTNVFNVVLQSRCLGCHQAGNAQAGVSYSNFTTTRQTVTAGNPNASALYTSIANNSMPRGGSALSAAEKELVRAWIAAGALNN